MSSDKSSPPKIRLLNEGLETPDFLLGHSGKVTVEKPNGIEITGEVNDLGECLPLIAFPTTGDDSERVPEGHIRLWGELYEIDDCRDLKECPECGSDKIYAAGDPPKCYTCENEQEGAIDG